MAKTIYIPIIKGKKNDLRALGELEPEVRELIKPLLELPPTPSSKTVNSHLETFIENVTKFSGAGRMFVDFYGFKPGEVTSSGTPATIAGYELLLSAGWQVTPVYGLGRDNAMWPQFQPVVNQHKQGFCFRLEEDDLEEDAAEATWEAILTRGSQIGLDAKNIDLLMDLRDVRLKSVNEMIALVIDFLSLQPTGVNFRSIAIAGSSAPKDVSVMKLDSIGYVVRNELAIWANLKSDLVAGGNLIYSDYGVVHPDFSADNLPVGGTANCKIRYTVGRNIMIVRGHKRAGDPGQPHTLADILRNHPRYCGQDYSVGDKYITDVADHETGPGNLGNWVLADMNHHITFAALQMEHLRENLTADLSQAETENLLDAVV